MNEPVDLSKFETIRDAYLNVIENYIPLCESDIVDFLRPDTFDKYMAFGIKIPRQLIEESKYYILKDKNYDPNDIKLVIETLINDNYLNDEAFIAKNQKKFEKKFGKKELVKKL